MANKYTATTFISETHKQCSRCKEIKEHSEFHKCKTHIHGKGLSYYCKECANTASRKHHNERVKTDIDYKLKKKDAYLQFKYGLSLTEYTEKLLAQKTCAICGVELSTNDPNVHLDHCHKTGKIRAFLCSNCNRGIGSFHDEPWKLESAIKYLQSHKDSVDT